MNDISGNINAENTLYLMDKKIIKPFTILGSMLYEKYRTKIVKDQAGNDLMRIDYDPSANPPTTSGLFAKMQQMVTGLLSFKIGDVNGNYSYSVKAQNFMTTTHSFRILDGQESQDRYSAIHKMMSLGKESLVISMMDGSPILSSVYRGYRKLINVTDSNHSIVATLHAPIISMRDRWKLDFNGECDRQLVLIMTGIMSELGER